MTVITDKEARPFNRFLARVVRYGVIGTIVSIIYSLTVVLLIDGLHVTIPTLASIVAFIFVLPLGYFGHRRITFFGAPGHSFAALRFVVTTATSFLIAIGGMYVITAIFHQSYLYSIALNWVVIPLVNFGVYYVWVFRAHKTTETAIAPVPDPGSSERFGYSWDVYSRILPEHEEQFRRWTAPIAPSEWRGVRFIDAGCGIGRNAYWPMTCGAASGVAIDIDPRTLAHAQRNLAEFPSVEVRRQSIYDLTEEDAFDIAFSIGVVHHLEAPDAAVARLVRATRPGGRVLLWLYGRENNNSIVRFLNPIRIYLLSRLPLGAVHALSWPLTVILWSILHLKDWRFEYFRLVRRFDFDHLRAIVFDHLIPRIAHYYTREEALTLCREAGLDAVEAVWVNEMSWTVYGRKPIQ